VQLWKRHEVRAVTVPHVDLALELAGRYRIGYYDALILASAHLADCAVVCSEDLNAGQDYGGVTVENPFVPPPARP
jgi:predicted nucleic acid-binding protein